MSYKYFLFTCFFSCIWITIFIIEYRFLIFKKIKKFIDCQKVLYLYVYYHAQTHTVPEPK